MECLVIFLVIIVGIVLLVSATSSMQANSDRWTSAYRRVANRFNGVCTAGGWFGRPSVRFRYGDSYVLLDTTHIGGPVTQWRMTWPDMSYDLEITPRRSPFAEPDATPIGSPRFDAEYVIRGRNPEQIRRLLSPAVQWAIDRARRLGGRDDIYVRFSEGHLVMRAESHLRDADLLLDLTEQLLRIYDQGLLTRVEGIEFGDSNAVTDDAKCPVCGDLFDHDVVLCRRCTTPHHRDCWNYNGACSRYGCRERAFVAADPRGGPARY